MKILIGIMSTVIALGALASEPTISQVTIRQRWPWSRLVDIDYVMSNAAQRMDIAVSGRNGRNPVDMPPYSLTGDLFGVSDGAHRIVWDPTVTACTNLGVLGEFNVTLTPTQSPLYMIVDLTKDEGADGQIEYVTEAALTNNQYGTWVRNPVTNCGVAVESVIWTGVTNDTAYKTDKLVLRRVPAGSYQMGKQTGENNVTLTRDMYVGVFLVTWKQWNLIMGSTGGTDDLPKYRVTYYQIREDPANIEDPAVNWPSNTAVNANSFVGRLRTRTGVNDFDLPTDAQWEYFCRAGTTTIFNDGNAEARYDGSEDRNNGVTNDFLDALGWYVNSSTTDLQPVGGKRPNAWGIYDTHGSLTKWCLDWYGTVETGTDPVGPSTGSQRVQRGGSYKEPVERCISRYRSLRSDPDKLFGTFGFRIVRTLP